MNQPDIESPCRKVCLLDPAEKTCRGCGRTLDEIAAWPTADRSTKRMILERCNARLKTFS
ncbi:MAG: DUF1289 domain-containing protein [Pseudomonadota bacterium]